MRVVMALLVMTLATGCLEWEEMEFRVLREGGEPSVIVMEVTNIYSSETENQKIKEDFDELIRELLGDEAVSDADADGIQLKGRELFIRDGKIVYRQTGIINGVNGEFQVRGSDITWAVGEHDEIAETNGKIVTPGSRVIVWPKDAKELRVRLRQPFKAGYKTSQPQMIQWLKEYLASRRDP